MIEEDPILVGLTAILTSFNRKEYCSQVMVGIEKLQTGVRNTTFP